MHTVGTTLVVRHETVAMHRMRQSKLAVAIAKQSCFHDTSEALVFVAIPARAGYLETKME